mmetsp:Transcript_20125/g.35768  ORF Transcript_20125/g.35768 Transcript_20125/m.35768 type:complete len:833 (-) Transcript_20125:142-2640(-)
MGRARPQEEASSGESSSEEDQVELEVDQDDLVEGSSSDEASELELVEGESESDSSEGDENDEDTSESEDDEESPGEDEEPEKTHRSKPDLKGKKERPRSAARSSRPKSGELQGDEDIRAEGDVSSDEDVEHNTIGNVPLHWYDEMDHIGYDKAGKKIERKEGMDEVDKLLASKDDPFYRRTVYDPKNDRSYVLTDRELLMVKRLMESKFPEQGFDAEPDYNDFFTREKMVTALTDDPVPKSRFVPSKWERMRILKLVHGIRAGNLSIGKKAPPKKPEFYLMWGDDDTAEQFVHRRKAPKHIPAPKVRPPGHRESYHPPHEYLPTEEEAEAWKNAHPDDRKLNFLPQDFKNMRKVPGYQDYVKERFERCLDLYLCPRVERRRLNIDPESLVPKLPSPSELRPYPTVVGVTYFGHVGRVRTIAISPTGELLASGGDDQTVRIWEVDTGRCLATIDVSSELDWVKKNKKSEEEEEQADEDVDVDENEEDLSAKPPVISLAWNPQSRYRVLAVGVANRVLLVHGGTGTACSPEDAVATHRMLSGALQVDDSEDSEDEEEIDETKNLDEEESEEMKRKRALQKSKGIAGWLQHGDFSGPSAIAEGATCTTTILFKGISQANVVDLSWHAKGEYLATVCSSKKSAAQVTIHHISKRLSQQPIRFVKDQRVQRVLFHPNKPILFVATKQFVNVYHLLRQIRIRVVKPKTRWISSIALHPKGDNLVVGSYDRRVAWVDLDVSDKPWKTFKYHRRAVRKVDFHRKYPLLASAADDGSLHIFHARVSEDLAKDPFLVPVKVLKGHTPQLDGLGVLDCVFHPTQPWIFSAGADGRVQLYQNIP